LSTHSIEFTSIGRKELLEMYETATLLLLTEAELPTATNEQQQQQNTKWQRRTT